jgi:WD40 repeat protein
MGPLYLPALSLLWEYSTKEGVYRIAISPDGRFIAANAGCGHIYLFDREGNLLWKHEIGCDSLPAGLVSVSSNGELVAEGSHVYPRRFMDYNNNYIYLFNREGDLLWSYKIPRARVNGVAISPSGEFIVAAVTDYSAHARGGRDKNYIYLFNREGNLIWRYDIGGSCLGLEISSDGEIVVVASSNLETYIYLFDRDGHLLWRYKIPEKLPQYATSISPSISISPDGKFIAVITESGYIYCVYIEGMARIPDLKTIEIANPRLELEICKYNIYISPGGKFIVISKDYCSDYLYLFNTEGSVASLLWSCRVYGGCPFVCVDISSDGRFMAVGTGDELVERGGSIYLFMMPSEETAEERIVRILLSE